MIILRFLLVLISLVIGFAGLLLPILPGWLFFVVAMFLLFPNTRLSQKGIAKIESRFPSVARALRRLTES